MCGVGGVTGRPGDPGNGASSRPGPAQIPREPGSRPRVPACSPVCLRVREAAAGSGGVRGPAARRAVPGRPGSGERMQTPRWRAGEGGPGQAPEGLAGGPGRSRGGCSPASGRTAGRASGSGERPAPGEHGREADGSGSRWPLSKSAPKLGDIRTAVRVIRR